MPAFIILVIIGVILLWLLICTIFYPLGKIIFKSINKILKDLEEDNEEY